MRAGGYNIGGEASGHIILSDHVTTGDGLVAALQVLAAIRHANRPASEICRRFQPMPQILENVPTLRRPNAAALKALTHTHECLLGAKGRLLVRASGTENLVRIMAEGEDLEVVRKVVDEVCGLLRNDLSGLPQAA